MLSTPPAFVLSQNQTLRYKNKKQTHDPITLKKQWTTDKTKNNQDTQHQAHQRTPCSAPHTNVPTSRHHNKIFQKLQDHTKKHDLNKIKKHIRYQPRTPTPHPKKRGYQCTVTTSRFTNTHHHNTTHKHAVSKTYWTKHTLEFSNNTPHQQQHTIRVIISRSVISPLHVEWQPIQLYSLLWRNAS